MKKFLCPIIYIFLYCAFVFSSCSDSKGISLEQTPPQQFESNEVIQTGKYYRIYKENITQVRYEIYDANGNVVLTETTDKPLTINMINTDIVDIGIGRGTGLAIHKYYSVERNAFSEDFSYVLTNFNELVAFIIVPENQAFKNRKVIIRNVFDQNEFYKEYQFNFSNIDTPVVNATFLKDGTLLQLTYLSGPEQLQTTEVLSITVDNG